MPPSRPSRWLLLALVGLGLGSSCSSISERAPSADRPKVHPTVDPPARPVNGTAELESGSGLVDGVFIATIVQINENEVTVNSVGWFTGAKAESEAAKRGRQGPPGGFLLVDEHAEEVTLSLADDVRVTSVWADWEIRQEIVSVEIDLPTLVGYFRSPKNKAVNIVADPFWITLENGLVTRLDEQYVA